MKISLPNVSTLVIPFVLFSLLNISEASPVRDGIPGDEAEVWHGTVDEKFSGPWSRLRKFNGEYADYGEYGAPQDFEPGPEDVPEDEPEVVEDQPADFPSNYGEFEGDEIPDAFHSSSEYSHSDSSQDEEEESVGGGDPDYNHELEGNVRWTSAVI